jgi:RecA-family ATPase
MQTVRQSVRAASKRPDSLPQPYRSLSALGIHFYRREISLFAASPGTGKSALAINLAIKMKVPTLYLSLDTSAQDMSTRLAAVTSGRSMGYIAKAMDKEEVEATLDVAEHVTFCFDSSMGSRDVSDELLAYVTVHGAFPQLLVVDNLNSLELDSDSEYSGENEMMKQLNTVARRGDMHVMVLHHVQGQYDGTTRPLTLGSIVNKVTKLPSLVLTLRGDKNFSGTEQMLVCPVKNRHGEADVTGVTGAWLETRLAASAVMERRY